MAGFFAWASEDSSHIGDLPNWAVELADCQIWGEPRGTEDRLRLLEAGQEILLFAARLGDCIAALATAVLPEDGRGRRAARY